MKYLLVKSELHSERGLFTHAKKLPYGRYIIPNTAMRMLSGIEVYIASKSEIESLMNAEQSTESEVTDEPD